jgi:hypothetical protein
MSVTNEPLEAGMWSLVQREVMTKYRIINLENDFREASSKLEPESYVQSGNHIRPIFISIFEASLKLNVLNIM